MTQRWLRNKKDGTIYQWNEILAANKNCEEVTEQQAFPSKTAPAHVTSRKKTSSIDLSVPDDAVSPRESVSAVSETIRLEASKGLPK
jgi:hypothetical protein